MKAGSSTSNCRPILSLKDLMWLFYLYPLRLLSLVLPCRLFLWLGRGLVPVLQLVTAPQRRAVMQYLDRIAEHLPPHSDSAAIARAFISNAAVRALEDLAADRLLDRGMVNCSSLEGLDLLDSALEKGRGAILLSVHTYAGRLGKRYLASCGYPVMSIRNKYPETGGMGRFGYRFLQPRYVKFLEKVIGDEVYVQDPDCSLIILRRLREGGLVNVYLDGITSREATKLPFLGAEGSFPSGFLEIARLTEAPIIPMLCLGDSRNLRINFGRPFNIMPAKIGAGFVSSNMPVMVRYMEKQILAHPDQWELWVKL